MCGICGATFFEQERNVPEMEIRAMCDAITHRGPDDEGIFTHGNFGIGMRRLSIIDLVTGRQPISNEDGSIWIVFNGEIYNHQELRDELQKKGHKFQTKSDTEAIVHAYEEYGEKCPEKLNGMFGFAILDLRNRTLFLARDRLGIKPLYYYADS
jgi:asparagine synthase (glutamine-hydrolysing)